MWPPTRPTVGVRGLSSVGRALPLQGRSQGFESPRLHNSKAQGVRDLLHAGITPKPRRLMASRISNRWRAIINSMVNQQNKGAQPYKIGSRNKWKMIGSSVAPRPLAYSM